MRFGLLGTLDVERDGESVALASGRQRALLARLLIAGGETVSADGLIEAVWGDDLPSNPANTLQQGIAGLRKALEPGRIRGEGARTVISDGPGYRMNLTDNATDVAEFVDGVAAARRLLEGGRADEAVAAVERALSLWRGPALADFEYADFARSERERLEELRIDAEELAVDAGLAAHGPRAVISELERLTAEHPLREGLWERLMRSLYQTGRQAEALRVYQEARRLLGEQLGIEPSPDLRRLEEQILLQDPALARQSRDRPRHNLPSRASRLIGREAELEALRSRLESARLVTLLGPGGSGKTRLAIEAALGLVDRHPDGVWLVRLDEASDPALLAAEIGAVIQMPEMPDREVVDTLATFIAERRMLLLLDNCERLVAPLAGIIETLLAASPGLVVLATSQEPFRLSTEQRMQVPPLSLPAESPSPFAAIDSSPAVELFLERMESVAPAVDRSERTLAAVANIVTALDGIPLAIELAAARTDVLTPEEVARGLADRFGLLDRGPRDAPRRQQTLRGAVEWAYQPLEPEQKSFLAALGVLVGGFDAAAAAAVAGVSESGAHELIAALVTRSLVVRIPDVAGSARYRMLETIRHYGLEQLGDDLQEVRRRHGEHFADRAGALDEALIGHDQVDAFSCLVADEDNMRAAMAWSLESTDPEPAVRIAARLGRFWDWRGSLAEASTWLGRVAVAGGEGMQRERAFLESWRAYFANELGDPASASRIVAVARRHAEDANDAFGLAVVPTGEALLARQDGDPQLALERGAEVRLRAAVIDDRWLLAWADDHDALSYLALGDTAAAERAARASLEGFADLGDDRARGWALTALAQTALVDARFDDAEALSSEAVRVSVDAGDGRNAAWAYEIAAAAASALGADDRAGRLDTEARVLLAERGMPSSPWRRSTG